MTAFDMTESIAPKSDQLNAEDLLSGPRTFTISEVKKGSVEQPVDVHLVEFPGRPFKPSKTVRRIMVGAWGPETSTYPGRRMTLYRDPEITFGKDKVGGIRIEAMSGIDKPLTLWLTVTRGKRAPYTVQPLPDAQPVTAGITARQIEQLGAAFRAANIADAATGLAYLSQTTGRDVAASKELTEAEAAAVLKALADSQPTEPTLPGAES